MSECKHEWVACDCGGCGEILCKNCNILVGPDYVKRLEKQNKIMRDALIWYATGMPWNDSIGRLEEVAQKALKEVGDV